MIGLLNPGKSIVAWWRRNTQSQLAPRVFERPDEVWRGYPVWINATYDGEDGRPVAASAEIGVVSPARLFIRRRSLFIRRRSLFRLGERSLPRIDAGALSRTFDVWGDDSAFAHRLFADPVIVKTLPLALHSGEQVEISLKTVKVLRGVVDDAVPDAVAAARALAIAIVSSLNLPRMVL